MDKDIKVSQGDGSRQFVDIKSVKPINNIKVIRPQESEYTDSDDMSSISEESVPKKKTKKILRKKENHYPEPRNYGAFSNPKKVNYEQKKKYGISETGADNTNDAGWRNNALQRPQVVNTKGNHAALTESEAKDLTPQEN